MRRLAGLVAILLLVGAVSALATNGSAIRAGGTGARRSGTAMGGGVTPPPPTSVGCTLPFTLPCIL